MTPILENQLRTRYPAMTAGLDGFWHGDGWFRVVSRLLELLEPHGVKLLQVKAKFGLLRVYTDKDGDAEVQRLVADAEWRSSHICQRCGFGDWSGLVGGCAGCEP